MEEQSSGATSMQLAGHLRQDGHACICTWSSVHMGRFERVFKRELIIGFKDYASICNSSIWPD